MQLHHPARSTLTRPSDLPLVAPLWLVLLLLLLPVAAIAQHGRLSCKEPKSPPVWDETPSSKSTLVSARDLRLTASAKLAKALSFNLIIQDTPDFYYEEFTAPATDTRPERHGIRFRPNPDSALLKGTLSFDLAKFFDTTADLKAHYTSLAKHEKVIDLGANPLAHESDKFKYFTRSRPTDVAGRLLSGIKISASIVERPKLSGGNVITDPVLREDDVEETFGLSFDPSGMFNTGSHLNNAVVALNAYARTYKDANVSQHLPCNIQKHSCFEKLAASTSRARFWASALPKFEFKTVDQFDFLRAGGRYWSFPFIEDELETYSLTWNFSSVFNKKLDRLAALESIKILKDLSAPNPTIESIDRKFAGGSLQLVYLAVKANGGTPELTWEVRMDREAAKACHSTVKGELIPGVAFSKGTIIGYPETSANCTFTLRVTDALGRSDVAECLIAIP